MKWRARLSGSLAEALWALRSNVRDGWTSRRWRQRPQSLNFEITSICDARCIHCPRQEMDRPVRPMEFGLFQRLIDQAAEMRVPELCPNGYGEILTLPNLERYLDYLSSKRHKFRVIINTNGHLMNEEKAELFLKHGVYLLNITIDGATPQTAMSVRVGLKTERIEQNIHRLLARRASLGLSRPKVRVGMVLIPQNWHERTMLQDKWQGVADYVGFAGASTRLGSVADVVDHRPAKVPVCVLPFRDLNVWADGKAVLCCHDWNEEYVVGDLNTESLREIWLGPEMTRARALHRIRQGHELEPCRKCNLWCRPSPATRLWS